MKNKSFENLSVNSRERTMKLFKNRNEVLSLIAIIFIGVSALFLRLKFALTYLPMILSELDHVPLAKHISFSLHNFYLPIESGLTNHLIFTDFVVKFGLNMFGETPLGMRLIFIILGMFSLVLVYKLLKFYSPEAAIFGIFLLAFNQYNIGQSILADSPGLVVFFSILSTYVFWVGVNGRKTTLWALGLIWICSYFTQELIVVFVPVYYLFILVSPEYRKFAKNKAIIFSYCSFFAVVIFHLWYINHYGTSLEYFSVPGYVELSFKPTLTGVICYLIRPICAILKWDYKLTYNWEIPLMSGLSGIVLFSGIIYSIKNHKDTMVRLLLLLTCSQIAIFTFVKTNDFIWGEPNWTKLSFIPAVCLTAIMFSNLRKSKIIYKYIIYTLCFFIAIGTYIFVMGQNIVYPPHRFATFVDCDTQNIELYSDQEFLDKPPASVLKKMEICTDNKRAIIECVKKLNICPNEVRVHNYLAENLYRNFNKKAAERTWIKALILEPFYVPTLESFLKTCDNSNVDFYDNMKNLKRGIQLLKQGYREEAVNQIRQLFFPEQYVYLEHYYHGIGYLYNGKLDLAEKEMTKAVKIMPQFMRAHADLAYIYIKRNRLDKAENILMRIVNMNPDYFLAYEYLADLFAIRKQISKAEQYNSQVENIIHGTLRGCYYESQLFEINDNRECYKIGFPPRVKRLFR